MEVGIHISEARATLTKRSKVLAQTLGMLACVSYASALFASENPYVRHELFCPVGSSVSPLDLSCTVKAADVEALLGQYQLIDARADDSPPLKNSWKIPVGSLRFKNFLKGTPLLVVGDVFSQRMISDACSVGRNLGLNISVAIGDGWPEHIQSALSARSLVSAEEVFLEYYLGFVTLVTPSSEVSKKLNLMGLKNQVVEKNLSDLRQVLPAGNALNHSSIVVIDSSLRGESLRAKNGSGVYVLDGGLESLGIYYRDMKKMHAGKVNANKNRALCAAL